MIKNANINNINIEINDKIESKEEVKLNKRINYQKESRGRKFKVYSTQKPIIRKNIDYDDREKDSVTGSINKLGSLDSESVCERIKVINETDDEFDSFCERSKE